MPKLERRSEGRQRQGEWNAALANARERVWGSERSERGAEPREGDKAAFAYEVRGRSPMAFHAMERRFRTLVRPEWARCFDLPRT